jgi:hypothetical protein
MCVNVATDGRHNGCASFWQMILLRCGRVYTGTQNPEGTPGRHSGEIAAVPTVPIAVPAVPYSRCLLYAIPLCRS